MANPHTPFFLPPPAPIRTQRINVQLTADGHQRFRHFIRPAIPRPTTPTALTPPPQPDDPAVDMLTFALSGPGLGAIAAFLAASAAFLLPNFEFGPRRTPDGRSVPSPIQRQRSPAAVQDTSSSKVKVYYLHLSLHTSRIAEFPDGRSRRLKEGDTILRFSYIEHCEAVARPLRPYATSYIIYTLDGISMRTLSKWPREINRSQPSAPTFPEPPGATGQNSVVDPAAVWAQYEALGESGELEEKWRAFMEEQPAISVEGVGDRGSNTATGEMRLDGKTEVAPCRLCGGTGTTRCFRCGGAASYARVESTCDCDGGRRPCEWCSGHGC